ncbi:major facilitator superfamily domain-containing protein [Mycena sp. CBHHK59/15]|nr:major facilitator superfamily domain-containing protein [Mycena sp. CBHHK59/15]
MMVDAQEDLNVRTETLETSGTGPTLPKEELDLQPPTFPEGGLQAWGTVAGAFLVQFCGFGYTTSFGVYQDFYTRDYLTQTSSSAISWIGSINALLLISGGLVSGRLYDRGHFHILLYGGSIFMCFSLFMLSLCKPEKFYQIFLAQGLGVGLGAGAVYVPSVAIVSHYFQKRRSLAMSIVASGSAFGAVIHPIMLNNTLRRHLGFANAVRASAGLISGLQLIACFLMHPRLPPSKTQPPFWNSLRRFGRDTPYILATAGLSIYTVGFYFPIFYLQLDAVTHGINQTFSFYAVSGLPLFLLMSRPLIYTLLLARDHERLQFRRPTDPRLLHAQVRDHEHGHGSAGCGAVIILCMIALKTIASVVIIGVLYGLCAGVFVTLMAPLLAVLTEDLGELGLRMGVSFAMVGIGGLIGPPMNGALLTEQFLWWRPALFSGLMAFTGFSFFVATLVVVRGRNVMKRKSAAALEGEKIQREEVA